ARSRSRGSRRRARCRRARRHRAAPAFPADDRRRQRLSLLYPTQTRHLARAGILVAMPRGRTSFGAAVILAASLTAARCGDDPPDKEIQQAQTAIDAAKAAGASDFAPAEFAGAEDALKRAHDAVAERDYRLALTSAIDSRERAQSAAAQAAEQKVAARSDAERLMASTLLALSQARGRLKAAESARAPAETLRAAQTAPEQA